jgi:DNA 3'-phosphatase
MSSSNNKRPDPPGGSPPATKKSKATGSHQAASKQSSLLQFFGKPKKDEKLLATAVTTNAVVISNEPSKQKAVTTTGEPKHSDPDTTTQEQEHDQPIIPCQVSPDRAARWKVMHTCVIVRTILPKEPPRNKVAAFDLDGTLFVWRIAGWPSKFEHYELWTSSVITKFQQLYDEDGYKLCIFSNQGAIRSAVGGKKATFVKSLIEWLASKIKRPLHVVMSTNNKKGYHKPNPGMWKICEDECNQGQPFDISQSFYVGDSAGNADPQGGVDEKFAKNIGEERDGVLKFYEPQDYFGPSDADQRKKQGTMQDYEQSPATSLQERAALLGGYIKGPIVLILVGVQGSGKSTFCRKLMDTQNDHWIHLSQDTINKGKPGKRELVEEATRQALKDGKSVVVDRTHLNEEQRSYFVEIAKECKVKVHAILLQPPKDVVVKRVRERNNHPAGVEGDRGVRLALASLEKVVVPKYQEGFDLVSCTGTETGVIRLSQLYQRISPTIGKPSLPSSFMLSNGIVMPSMALGSMGIGKRKAEGVVATANKIGWKAVDTAPTYKNESEVSRGLQADTFVVVKVPKRATRPEQVREELNASLANLGRKQANLLLLHWPCDVIETGTLKSVWQEMEQCLSEGLCHALGVCNFSIDALRQLIPLCKVPPSVNQIERHPLLPQMELVQFCANHDILVQAHTALGQGKADLLENAVVVEIAKETGLSSAQVVLKWNLQHGVAVVPKCTSEDHLKQAIGVIGGEPLKSNQMQKVDSIEEHKRFVAPPFMYSKGAPYTWGDRAGKK